MTRRSRARTWDDYFIPGTTVLRNKFIRPGKPYGETDPLKLRTLEEQRTRLRMMELRTSPIPGRFDYDHMKAIHAHVFQDVYEWAGEERTAPTTGVMTKAGHAYYPAGPALTAAAEVEYAKIAASDYLRGMDHDEFVVELAERWGELNTGGSALLL
jgi:cell filamentation protein